MALSVGLVSVCVMMHLMREIFQHQHPVQLEEKESKVPYSRATFMVRFYADCQKNFQFIDSATYRIETTKINLVEVSN